MRTLQAIKDKVFVEVIKETVTKGGLFLPENAEDSTPHKYGRIISKGSEVMDLEVGDLIAYAKFGGQATILNNKEYRVLMVGEIYGKVIDTD